MPGLAAEACRTGLFDSYSGVDAEKKPQPVRLYGFTKGVVIAIDFDIIKPISPVGNTATQPDAVMEGQVNPTPILVAAALNMASVLSKRAFSAPFCTSIERSDPPK